MSTREMHSNARGDIRVNGRTYKRPSSHRPLVVICVDGEDPSYIDYVRQPSHRHLMPNLNRFIENGFYTVGNGVVPSFTNPNNISIITGCPPSVHGISGNFFVDPETNQEVMMNDPKFLRCKTILSQLSDAGEKVLVITAKDKLRKLLGKDLNIGSGCINFSSEQADKCTIAEHGIDNVLQLVSQPLPPVYSADLSLFVLDAAIRILQGPTPPSLCYLSLTDYIQHKHAPGAPLSNAFHQKLDEYLGKLNDLGAIVAVTADHGMNDKTSEDGTLNVVFLQDRLDDKFGVDNTRVVCPITDPYVVHHGALGGFVRVYVRNARACSDRDVMEFVRGLAGVEAVFDRVGAVKRFELPMDIEADVVVVSDARTVIGSSEKKHDLSGIQGERLRSHGGIAESKVPILLNVPLTQQYLQQISNRTLYNYDIFDIALNGSVWGGDL